MSVRWAPFSALVVALGLLVLPIVPNTYAQNAGVDRVTYRNAEGKIVTDTAEVKESLKGVELTSAGKSKSIPANDVIKVEPGSVAGVAMAEVLAVRGQEDSRDFMKLATDYGNLVKKAGPNAPDRTKRYLTFREAVFTLRAVDQKTGEEFTFEAPKAFDKLTAFAQLNRKTWEIWPVLRASARIQAELGNYTKAADLLRSLGAVAELPKELRFEAVLAEAGMQYRAEKHSAAEGLLATVEKDKDFPPTGPLKDRLNVLRAACKLPTPTAPGTPPADLVAKVVAAIEQAKDPVAKAVGYNCLGETQLAFGQVRDAMWSFLWVDVVYNQDRDEQILAVRRLTAIFDKLGDKDRAEQFREKLPRIR